MTAINEIPDAFGLQTQLMAVETAIANLKTGALVSGISVLASAEQPGIGQPLKEETRVALDPSIDDQVAIDGVVAMLEGQMNKLIKELQALGFTYTGTAIPTKKPVSPQPSPEHLRLMETAPPSPDLPTARMEPPPFPEVPPMPEPPPMFDARTTLAPPRPEPLPLPTTQPTLPEPLVETVPGVSAEPPAPPPVGVDERPIRPQLNRN